MRGRFCYLAEREFGPKEFSRVIETLHGRGITLANPWNRKVSRLTDDGDQVETSQAEIADIVQAALAITFQLWISEDTDLVCSLYPLANGAFAHRYNLDGLASKERCIVESWAVDYFKKRSTVGMALLLVVDDDGSTVESDWDGFAEGRLKAPNRAPEIIGVCPPLEVQYSGSFTDLNGCRLITNPISKDGHTGESRGQGKSATDEMRRLTHLEQR